MNITFIGYGNVGLPLARHMAQLGHTITLAARDAQSKRVQKALEANPHFQVASPQEAVSNAEVVFLATPFGANKEALESVKTELAGKILVDCTNPVGPGLTHGLNNEQSGSEFVQSLIPESPVVKAFSIYGYENFENNHYPDYNLKPAMLFCGHDATAKARVAELIEALNWQAVDVGGLEQALHLEHMTLMWVRRVRMNGMSPHQVWGALTR